MHGTGYACGGVWRRVDACGDVREGRVGRLSRRLYGVLLVGRVLKAPTRLADRATREQRRVRARGSL